MTGLTKANDRAMATGTATPRLFHNLMDAMRREPRWAPPAGGGSGILHHPPPAFCKSVAFWTGQLSLAKKASNRDAG